MKKISLGFVLTLLMIFSVVLPSRAEESVLDQSCTGIGGLNMLGQSEYQTFTPSLNRLTRIDLYLSVEATQQTVNLQVYHGASLLLNAAQQQAAGTGWVTFSFSPIEVTPGDTNHRFYAYSSGTSDWTQNDANPYSGGAAYESGVPIGGGSADFNFRTYGYNYTPPAGGNNTGGTTTGTTGTSGSGSTPATTTSSSIVKPSGLKAVYDATAKAVNLSWTKSTTTDIDGYRVYRSEQETKGFQKVGQVGKTIAEYSDATAANEKTYYYYVRAYKGTSESASSNTVNIAIPKADAAVTAPIVDDSKLETSAKTNPTFWQSLLLYKWPILIGGIGLLLLLVVLIIKYLLPKIRAKRQMT